MTVEQHQRSGDIAVLSVVQGFVIGLLAAIVMAIVMMIGSLVAGNGLWAPINAIGGLIQPTGVDQAGFAGAVALWGMLIHLAVGGLLGALYASAQERIDNRSLILVALYYGFIIWFVSSFIVLNWLLPHLQIVWRMWPVLIGHLAFGAVLGLYAIRKNGI